MVIKLFVALTLARLPGSLWYLAGYGVFQSRERALPGSLCSFPRILPYYQSSPSCRFKSPPETRRTSL